MKERDREKKNENDMPNGKNGQRIRIKYWPSGAKANKYVIKK